MTLTEEIADIIAARWSAHPNDQERVEATAREIVLMINLRDSDARRVVSRIAHDALNRPLATTK